MNSRDLTLHNIPDVQNTVDTRRLSIQRVGVKGVRYPITIKTASGTQPTVGTWNMYVQLPEEKIGRASCRERV